MAWKNLNVERGAVTLLRVNRPEQRNAIDFSTMDELETVLSILEADDSLRALVLTGGGDTFISGGDLKDFQSLVTAADGKRMAERMGAILTTGELFTSSSDCSSQWSRSGRRNRIGLGL